MTSDPSLVYLLGLFEHMISYHRIVRIGSVDLFGYHDLISHVYKFVGLAP